MTILHLTLSLARGGRREAMFSLVDGLRELGVESEIGCLGTLGCEPFDVSRYKHQLHVFNRRGLFDRAALSALARVCREKQIDIIHAHDAASQFAGSLVWLRLPRLRLLMTFHRSLPIDSATYSDRCRNAVACLATSAVVTGSRERREHFLGNYAIAERKVVRIPFGVATQRFQPAAESRSDLRSEWQIPPDTIVIGAVGHFGPEKGMDVAIRGFHALRRRLPEQSSALVIVGDGAAEQARSLRELADQDRHATIMFLGFRADVARCTQAFEVFVHAPRQEAFGLVLAEAMAAGLPVVATRVGGVPDIVRDGQTGFLVECEDAEALGGRLAELAVDARLRAELGQAGRQIAASEYDVSTYAANYARLYRDLMDGMDPRGVDDAGIAEIAGSFRPAPRECDTAHVGDNSINFGHVHNNKPQVTV